ncbi:MAG TPA: acyl-CoA thioesterase [Vicinamibacterales bacterium]
MKTPSDSLTEMVQFVLPNDANPLGFMLGGSVMHLIDIAGAVAASRHARMPLVTAAVDDLQFLHPIRVGDLIVLRAWVNATFTTSMEVEVEVQSEETLTGRRTLTSRAYLTFVTIGPDGQPAPVPPLRLETEEERQRAEAARQRRAERLARRNAKEETGNEKGATAR